MPMFTASTTASVQGSLNSLQEIYNRGRPRRQHRLQQELAFAV